MDDYIALAAIASVAIFGGFYLISQAKAYRRRMDAKHAEIWDQAI